MNRFIVRYRGQGPRPADAIERLSLVGARVLEDAGRTLLVEAEEGGLRALFSEQEWLVSPEQTYELPDPQKRIERGGK